MKKTTVSTLLLGLCLTTFMANAQTPEQRAKIMGSYDQERSRALQAELKQRYEANWKRTLELVEAKGWPLRMKNEDGTVSVLSGITKSEQPIYKRPTNVGSAITSRITDIRPGGSTNYDLTGEGMIMGVWEVGPVRDSHIDLFGRVTFGDETEFEDDDPNAGHATHVAGTMIGSGLGNTNARGIAYEAELIAYNSANDVNEVADAAAEGLLVSNHSYGWDWDFLVETNQTWRAGAYTEECRQWDNVMVAHPYYVSVLSAGNDRQNEEKDELTGTTNCKNAIAVAATFQVNNYNPNNPGAVQIAPFSSYGPTDDLRVKPDISTKGMEVFSGWSYVEDGSDADYFTTQGTSMAAPGIAGALILLQEHWSNLYEGEGVPYMRAATLKGLMSHTADECGNTDGPDYRFGWGLMNATKAAQVISSHFDLDDDSVLIEERVRSNGNSPDEIVVKTKGNNVPLKVSISWTDPTDDAIVNSGIDDSTVKALVNDLDLRVVFGDEEYLPWKLSSVVGMGAQKVDNDVDNIEIVEIPAPIADADYIIKVTKKGFLQNNTPQPYTLIVTGMEESLGMDENVLSAHINVYPNPAKDILHVMADISVDASAYTLEIYDIQGRLVKQFGAVVNEINVSDLSTGIYILNIKKGGAVATKKIIIE